MEKLCICLNPRVLVKHVCVLKFLEPRNEEFIVFKEEKMADIQIQRLGWISCLTHLKIQPVMIEVCSFAAPLLRDH